MTYPTDYLPMIDGEYADEDGDALTIAETYDLADDFIDQHWPMARACGLAFSPSEVLRECAPTAYRAEVASALHFMLDCGTLTRVNVLKDAPVSCFARRLLSV